MYKVKITTVDSIILMSANMNINSTSNTIINFMDILRTSQSAKQRIIYFKLVIGMSHLLPNNVLKSQIEHMFHMTKDNIIHIRLSALQSLLMIYQKLQVNWFSLFFNFEEYKS